MTLNKVSSVTCRRTKSSLLIIRELVTFNGLFYDWSSGNGKVSAWDEISDALSAKKAELSKDDGLNQEESSGWRSWSYRALRGSALGPTMALLRAQNEL